MSVQSSNEPLSGLWQPQSYLKSLYYGVGCVEKHLSAALPTSDSKVFVLTGKSIAEKTPLLQRLSSQLGPRLGGSFSGIKQHAQVDGVDEAFELVASNESVDTVISLGGGSPIDAAKTIVFRVHEKSKRILVHIAIPTTLSAAECTAFGGFTNKDGTKVAVGAPWAGASTIFYDAEYAKYTPTRLWTATGLRALDHAVESMYQPYASEMPWRTLSLSAVETLFECLPKSLDAETNTDDNITRLLLAANASLGFKGKAIKGGMGLSHSLGFALGSSYDIPRKCFQEKLTCRYHGGHKTKLTSIDRRWRDELHHPEQGRQTSGCKLGE